MTERLIDSADSNVATVRSSHSTSLARRLQSSEFQRAYQELVEYDIAEAVVRLRRFREIRQRDLARAIGTWQPAIARIESGAANPRLSTLKRLARALGARLRVAMDPEELVFPDRPAWWDCVDAGLVLRGDVARLTIVGTMHRASGEYQARAVLEYTEPDASYQVRTSTTWTVGSSPDWPAGTPLPSITEFAENV